MKTKVVQYDESECGGPKKSIAIFAYLQRLLSIDMKTKKFQHVKSERMRECDSERV